MENCKVLWADPEIDVCVVGARAPLLTAPSRGSSRVSLAPGRTTQAAASRRALSSSAIALISRESSSSSSGSAHSIAAKEAGFPQP